MTNFSRRVKRAVELAPTVYTAGLLFGVVLFLLVITGRVRVRHWQRLFATGPVILAPNHPSMLEPFLLLALFAPVYLVCPWLMPWGTPDVSNFMEKKWFFFARKVCIGIARKGSDDQVGKARKAARQIIEVLNDGDTVAIHPEGGRTSSGNGPRITSKTGRTIRQLKRNGLTLCVGRVPNLRIVPVWFEGTDRVMPRGSSFPWRWWYVVTIEVGEPFEFPPDTEDEDVLRRIEQEILSCGDRV